MATPASVLWSSVRPSARPIANPNVNGKASPSICVLAGILQKELLFVLGEIGELVGRIDQLLGR